MRKLIFVFFLHLTNIYADDCLVPSLQHGEVRGSGDTKSWVGKLSCNPGYSLLGSATLKCRGGQWSSSVPVCTAVGSCDPDDLPSIDNGRVDPYKARKYRRSVYKYSCERGYKRWGAGLVHCTGNTWDLTKVPVCHRTDCAGLEEEMMGGEVRRMAEGGLYFYHCTRPGSLLSGSPVLVCTETGWNDTAPHCSYGPEVVSLTGPETAEAGETVSYTCSGLDSNPPAKVEWEVRDHSGESAMHLVKVSQLSTTTSEEGWATSSSIEVRVPRDGQTLGLHLACTVTNPELSQETVKEQRLAVQFGPSDLSISGPGEAAPGEKLSVRCESSPSVPPAQISWIVSQSARPLQSQETIHSTHHGSFATVSRMNVTVPSGARVEDIVVQCVATQPTLGEASLEAVHVIKVSSSDSTPGVSGQTTTVQEVGVEETTGAIEQLDYYGSDYSQEYHPDLYSEAASDIDNKLEDSLDTTTGSADSAYNEYKVEAEIEKKAEEEIDHVLLPTHSEGEQEKEEKDAVMSAKHSAAGGSSKHQQPELEIPTKSEPTDISSYSSQRDATISMTEKTESAPMKASPKVTNNSSNIRYSILFLILPILISRV